ncbi:A20/AN1 zinc finger family protein [Trifolium repens]|nr:A20/AN1 zinc finger family protein [Trifolium repens]
MAEEHRCQAQRLCANNCGFFGIPAMQDLCSKCYRDLQLKEQRSSSAKLVLNQTLISQSQPSISVSETVVQQSPSPLVVDSSTLPVESVETAAAVVVQPNRYPEMHECGFDFKGMGREMIAKANPVVKGEKLNKI